MQLFILQIPVSLQNTSILAFVLSLSIVVLESARKMSEGNKVKVGPSLALSLAILIANRSLLSFPSVWPIL
jgi:hypothetical protein